MHMMVQGVSFFFLLFCLIPLGLGIYTMMLLIKALKVYIDKNS